MCIRDRSYTFGSTACRYRSLQSIVRSQECCRKTQPIGVLLFRLTARTGYYWIDGYIRTGDQDTERWVFWKRIFYVCFRYKKICHTKWWLYIPYENRRQDIWKKVESRVGLLPENINFFACYVPVYFRQTSIKSFQKMTLNSTWIHRFVYGF